MLLPMMLMLLLLSLTTIACDSQTAAAAVAAVGSLLHSLSEHFRRLPAEHTAVVQCILDPGHWPPNRFPIISLAYAGGC